MGITLVVNPGSSSKKYALFQNTQHLFSMRFERNGNEYGLCRISRGENATCQSVAGDIYNNALRAMLDESVHLGHLSNLKDIERVGVRVVAPGTYFTSHRVVDRAYLQKFRQNERVAPLHMPHIRQEIEQIERELPFSTVVGVSDSAFHTTMPFPARNYSLDRKDTKNHDLYRFGYHGLSVGSVVRRLPDLFGELPSRVVVLHIGSGVSATAVKDGKSIDTTMGFSPVSGLVMGTRAGDVESGALLELMRVRHFSPVDALTYLNTAGGLQGVAGVADLRHVLEHKAQGDEQAIEAFSLFSYHLTKAVGGFVAALGGLDAIVFTATAGERNPDLRAELLAPLLSTFSISLDESTNQLLTSKDGIFSTSESKVKVAVMRTDEMGEIARIAGELK